MERERDKEGRFVKKNSETAELKRNKAERKRNNAGRFVKKAFSVASSSTEIIKESAIPPKFNNHDALLATENSESHSETTELNDVNMKEFLPMESELVKKEKQAEKDMGTIETEKEMKAKLLEEQRKMNEEACFKRLKALLSKSSFYVKYLAEKLQTHEGRKKTKMSNRKIANSDDKPHSSNKRQRVAYERDHVKANMLEVYKKKNMNEMTFNDLPEIENCERTSHLVQQPKLLCGGILRSYQLDGFEWLKSLYENGVNGVLADEMGLGKTIQCISLIASLIEKGVSGPFFVCCPLSTIVNWCSEFKRFAPDVPVILYHAHYKERKVLINSIMKKTRCGDFVTYPVVVTSYEVALNDCSALSKIRWITLIIDEAQRIKNHSCRLRAALVKYNSSSRFLLTGTPLQNNLIELWSLLNFILPEIFDDLQVFESWFNAANLSHRNANQEIIAKEEENQIVYMIHQILTPFLLRRTKSEVELQLPIKREVIVKVPMTKLQKEYYQAALTKSIEILFGRREAMVPVDINSGRPKRRNLKKVNYSQFQTVDEVHQWDLNQVHQPEVCRSRTEKGVESYMRNVTLNTRNLHMLLRRICCHPYLISHPLDVYEDYRVDAGIINDSGKMLVLDLLLQELRKKDHRILLFSQFTTMLDILENYCHYKGYTYCRLDGTMSLVDRQQEIDKFTGTGSSTTPFIFLISTRAGGLGLNLTAADTVIIYDMSWNPQVDLQAQDRCHRIGQEKTVMVYRLVTTNTAEVRMMDRATAKLKMEKVIMQKGRFTTIDSLLKCQPPITRAELSELLESCDRNATVEAGEEILSKEELEQLLDRSHPPEANEN